jgi:hypothetical protein
MIGSASITGAIPTAQWLLNADPTPILGKVYQWDDTATWNDVTGIIPNVWKD